MPGLALIAALAAQATTQPGLPSEPTTAPVAQTGTAARSVGETTYLDLEGGAGYSSDPLMSLGRNGESGGSAFGRLSAHAVHTMTTDRTTTVFSAFGQSLFYTNRYGSSQSFDVNARHDAAVTENLRVFADGDLSYDRGGQLDTRILSVPDVPLLPGTIVPPPLLTQNGDFLTVTGKSYRANADVGGQLSLDPRDFLDASAGVDHDISKIGTFDTRYTRIPLTFGYERALNERTSIGARLVADFTHYSGDILGSGRNFRVVTPEFTAKLMLSEQLTFTGDVGASFSSFDEGTYTRHTTGLAADANLCSVNERTQLCARASVQQQAATSAGPTNSVMVGVDYTRKLGEFDTLQLSVSGDRYSNPTLLVAVPTFSHATYLRAAADYSRKIGRRLFAGVDLAARKITGNGADPKADLSATAFIRYRLGDIR